MTTTAPIRYCDAQELSPYHGVQDTDKLDDLTASMDADGWQGAPLVAWEGCGYYNLLNGSHRYAAAVKAGIEIPVVLISDDEDGPSFLGADLYAEAVETWAGEARCDWGVYEVSRLIESERPDLADEYGLDIG